MRRMPNLSISQWFRQNIWHGLWVIRARCGDFQELPWTSDIEPATKYLMTMQSICARCPVVRDCADHALTSNGGKGIEGGFYAGIWVPWLSTDTTVSRTARDRALLRLRGLLVASVMQ